MGVKLKAVFPDTESVAIVRADDGSGTECLYWIKDEWVEDPDVCFSIANAIKQAYEDPERLFNEDFVQNHYINSVDNCSYPYLV